MFKGTDKPTSKEKLSYKGIEIYPVLRAQDLLVEEKHKLWLEKLPDLVGFTTVRYKLYCQPVLYNFVEFVQNLPATKQGLYYAHSGGVADQGIERCVTVLESLKKFVPEDVPELTDENIKQLWKYAVFTASLLLDVGKIAAKTIVTLRDHTHPLRIWNPFEGSMVNLATHYSYDFSTENYDVLRRKITPMLAKALIPDAGFQWLSSNKDVLRAWFELFEESYQQLNAWMSIIPFIDAQMLDTYFDKYVKEIAEKSANVDLRTLFKEASQVQDLSQKLKSPEIAKLPLLGGLFTKTESIASTKTKHAALSTIGGEAFLQWLKKGVASEKISVNLPNSSVHVIGEGVLLLEKAFKDFVKENPFYGNWQDIKKQFERLDITKQAATSTEYGFRHYASTSSFELLKEFVIVLNRFIVFAESQKIPAINPHIVSVDLMKEKPTPYRPETGGSSPAPQSNPQGR